LPRQRADQKQPIQACTLPLYYLLHSDVTQTAPERKAIPEHGSCVASIDAARFHRIMNGLRRFVGVAAIGHQPRRNGRDRRRMLAV